MKYDTPIEVSKTQYDYLMRNYCGVVAGREEDGKYFIKVWLMQYVNQISKYLNN